MAPGEAMIRQIAAAAEFTRFCLAAETAFNVVHELHAEGR
jgi:hypothetical protein